MTELSIALEEGFQDDVVTVEVNGRMAFESDRVTTRTQIGLAKPPFTVSLDGAEVSIEVRVPSREAAPARLDCRVTNTLYVGVSIRGGELELRTSEQPFGYL